MQIQSCIQRVGGKIPFCRRLPLKRELAVVAVATQQYTTGTPVCADYSRQAPMMQPALAKGGWRRSRRGGFRL